MCEKSTRYARGTVWWVETKDDSMCTTSQKGRRPFLIISNNEFNRRFGKVTVIPMSHQDKYEQYDFVISTIIDGKKCYALVDQIRQMDNNYLKSYAYTLNPNLLAEIDVMLVGLYTGLNFEDSEDVEDVVETNGIINTPDTHIDCLDNHISELNDVVMSTKSMLSDYAEELNLLLSNINNSLNSIRTVNVNESKKSITDESSKSIKKSTSDKIKRRKHSSSSMPYKFYSDVNNNIDFWNDLLVNGEEYVRKTYNLEDDSAFRRRKSRVKVYLKSKGYDITDIIDKEIV